MMAVIRIYGHKGCIVAQPFQINSVDTEVKTEEEQIVNSSASDTEQTE